MTCMTTATGSVTGGVDTHGQTHHGAVLDQVGRQLGDREFPATPSGYGALLQWMRGYGVWDRVGVEGTGTYGAGLTRHLVEAQVRVVEVDRRCQMVCVNTSMEVSSDDDGCYGIEQGCAGGAGAA